VIDERKIGKSLGNAVDPLALAEIYGVDAFRYFLLRDMVLGRDAVFSQAGLRRRYEADLANDLGNLLRRVVSMINRYYQGQVPAPGQATPAEEPLREGATALVPWVFEQTAALAINPVLARLFEYVGQINLYLEQTAPWSQAKAGQTERVATSLYTAAEALRLAAVLLHPVLPQKTAEIWRRLGWSPPDPLRDGLAWGGLQPGSRVVIGAPLFPKERV